MNFYRKLDDQWCIVSSAANLQGQTVTVTKRNGATKQVQLAQRVAEVANRRGQYDYYYAIAERPAPAAEAVGDLSAIVQMFDRARLHQRFPSVTLDGFRVSIAGDRAREPGSLTITSASRGEDGRRAWFGRVTLAGNFEPARNLADPAIVAGRLREFAADPAGVAAAYGRINRQCCFCNKQLGARAGATPSPTALKSLAVGYGRDCAEHFGLPWGAVEVEAA